MIHKSIHGVTGGVEVNINKCQIINFPKIKDARGNLTFIEENYHVPFEIKRVYYLYDVPSGVARGGHAHKETEQLIIALSGSFNVIIDDGFTKKSYFLNSPHYGIYIPTGIWRELENFSSNSIALSLVSSLYEERDYVRDYETFKKIAKENSWSSK